MCTYFGQAGDGGRRAHLRAYMLRIFSHVNTALLFSSCVCVRAWYVCVRAVMRACVCVCVRMCTCTTDWQRPRVLQ